MVISLVPILSLKFETCALFTEKMGDIIDMLEALNYEGYFSKNVADIITFDPRELQRHAVPF